MCGYEFRPVVEPGPVHNFAADLKDDFNGQVFDNPELTPSDECYDTTISLGGVLRCSAPSA